MKAADVENDLVGLGGMEGQIVRAFEQGYGQGDEHSQLLLLAIAQRLDLVIHELKEMKHLLNTSPD